MEVVALNMQTPAPVGLRAEGPEQVSMTLSVMGGGGAGWYEGPYEVTPRRAEQTLGTAKKVMREDVTVHEIPWWETSNPYGTTYVIGE